MVINRTTVETTKKGRFPQILAPAAVKKVVKPIQKARKPIRRLDTMSRLTLYFAATTWRPGVTIGPKAVVIPELNARITMMDSFQVRDQLSGSFGLSDG